MVQDEHYSLVEKTIRVIKFVETNENDDFMKQHQQQQSKMATDQESETKEKVKDSGAGMANATTKSHD